MSSPFHSEGLSKAIIEGGKPGVREWARNATDEELDVGLHTCHPTNEHTKIVQMEVDRRRALLADNRLAQIEADLATVREQIMRPEWRTWVFWFTLIAVILGGLTLVRDYLNLQRPDPAPVRAEPTMQSTKTSHSDRTALPAAQPQALAPVPSDTKATAPTSEPSSK